MIKPQWKGLLKPWFDDVDADGDDAWPEVDVDPDFLIDEDEFRV